MFLISLVITGFAFSCQMKKREPYGKTQLIFGGIFLVVAFFLQNVFLMDRSEIRIFHVNTFEIVSTIIVCIGVLLLVALWIYKTRQASFDDALYASAMAYLAQHSIYCIQNVLSIFIAEKRWSILEFFMESPYFRETGSVLIVVVLSVFFYFMYGKRMMHENHYISSIRETLPLLGIIITIVMVFSALASKYDFVFIHSVYGLVFCLFILTSQMERQKTLVDELDAKIREQLLVTQQAQYKIYRENADLLNVKSHDLKHQIAVLRMMYDDKTGEEVINSIAGTVRIYDSFVRTGNDGLDTILTSKNQICLDKNILFTCMVDGKLLSSMDQVDLYSLFGNLMDNAIEAVEYLPERERSISLSVKENLGMIQITEENPCGDVKREKGRFLTTKADKVNHGYGLQSMEMVAKKYDGVLSTDVKDGVFSLNIMLYFE